MRRRYFVTLLLMAVAIPAFADDQQKAEKQMRMMTAMSRDDTARSIISRTFADNFKMARPNLVEERKSLGLSYGGMFLLHELTQSGTPLQQIVGDLRARKTMIDIANSSHADWKRIAGDAKKMNKRIDDGIYKHFLHSKPDEERDKAERYTASADLVRADLEATQAEILKAQQDYIFWRNLTAPINGGQADPHSAFGQAYQQARQDIEDSHGNLASTSMNH